MTLLRSAQPSDEPTPPVCDVHRGYRDWADYEAMLAEVAAHRAAKAMRERESR